MNNQQNGALKTQSQGNLPVFAQPAFIPPLTQEEEELNLRQVLSVVKHRWWIIAGITLGVTGAIAGWTFLKTPIYEPAATFRGLGQKCAGNAVPTSYG